MLAWPVLMSICHLLQFLSLDDFPDSRANVDLKNDQASSVSVLGLGRWGAVSVLLCVEVRALPPHPQELLIIPLLPMALVAPDEVEKSSNPLYRYNTGQWGEGRGCLGRALSQACFCQHSCQGEVLASRKDFRMNTCTPDPRGSFMLDPVGMCPVEPVDVHPMPRSQKGKGLEVGLTGREGVEVSLLGDYS